MPCLACLPCDGLCGPLLCEADALSELPSLRRDLRALLLQADALFLHAHCAACECPALQAGLSCSPNGMPLT